MSAVHTHEGYGTLHIEADTLGEKLTLDPVHPRPAAHPGASLSPAPRSAASRPTGERLEVTSDGTPAVGDPTDLLLAPDQRIELSLP